MHPAGLALRRIANTDFETKTQERPFDQFRRGRHRAFPPVRDSQRTAVAKKQNLRRIGVVKEETGIGVPVAHRPKRGTCHRRDDKARTDAFVDHGSGTVLK